jgi:nucleoside-diphosphate-sugar epimerase
VSIGRLAFVTGGSGLLGRRFLRAVRDRHPSLPIRALVHRRPLPLVDGVEPVEGNLDDVEQLAALLRGVDIVVHLAAVTHAARAEDYLSVNGRGAERLARAAARAGVGRFVHVSTRAIHAECGAYGASKRFAEEALRAAGISHVILRFAEVYGAGSAEGVDALLRLVRRSPVVPYPAARALLAPLFVDDAIAALVRAVERSDLAGMTYTIAGPDTYSPRALIRAAAQAFGVRRVFVPVPLPALGVIARLGRIIGRSSVALDQLPRLTCPKDSCIDDARRDLGFSPRTLREGLIAIGNAPPDQ